MIQPTPFLDTEAAYQIDSLGIAGYISAFTDQIREAQSKFNDVALPDLSNIQEIIFCGMGGSGIGGELATDLPPSWLTKPMYVVREYNLPAFVSTHTLVVIVSFSGETEEALSCFKEALHKKAKIIAITGGGELAKLCQENNIPVYIFTYTSPPRDALGYLFTPLIKILEKADVISETQANLNTAIQELDVLQKEINTKVATAQNMAKKIAYAMYDHIALTVGTNTTKAVARRFKCQFNEHSKNGAWFEILPELNHNCIEGFSFPHCFVDDIYVILIKNTFDHPEVTKRMNIFTEFLNSQHVPYSTIEPRGDDFWTQKLTAVLIGDWVSYYLALLNRVDPGPIPAISGLKNKLRGLK